MPPTNTPANALDMAGFVKGFASVMIRVRSQSPVAFAIQALRKSMTQQIFANTGRRKEVSLSNARTPARAPRIVSDQDNSSDRRPTLGSRRVSALVAVPVIAACAVLGSVIGTTHPLHSMFPAAQRGGERGDLRLASVRLVEAPAEAPGSSGPHGALRPPPASAPSSALAASTGSLDRPLSAGGRGEVAATQRDRPELVTPEGAPRATNQSHRQARAKRLRRMLGRHTRPKTAGAQVDAFISSILPSK